ncbi:MAG: HAD family hydrolase [bacterium]|nr:HAD family hydrolase [bacterium]
MNKIKWIFFDIGGVLRDETEYNNWRKDILLLKAREINPEISDYDFEIAHNQASKTPGSLRQNILEILTGDKELAERLKNEIHGQGTKILQNIPIMPNAIEVVKKLSENYSLGVISNYSSAITGFLGEAGLADYFKVLGISEDYGLAKPNPEFFKAVLKDAKAEFKESAMIDDNIERGLQEAKVLGMTTVFFNATNRQDIPEDIVDFTVYSLTDLLNIL